MNIYKFIFIFANSLIDEKGQPLTKKPLKQNLI